MEKYSQNSGIQDGLVSVIVPTYNRAALLRETIKSILDQTYSKLELIIVSDGSTDETPQVVEDIIDDRIVFINNKENSKLPALSRNLGIRYSRGEFIAFCDDDDIWLPQKLEQQIALMKRHPEIGLCCTAPFFLFPNGEKRKSQNILSCIKNLIVSWNIIPPKYLLVIMNYIINSSVLMRKSVVDKVGFISEDPIWRASEDFDYWFRISEKNIVIYYLKNPLVVYRFHINQISNLREGKKRFFKVLKTYDLDKIQVLLYYFRALAFKIYSK